MTRECYYFGGDSIHPGTVTAAETIDFDVKCVVGEREQEG
jgi:hypothetical protein